MTTHPIKDTPITLLDAGIANTEGFRDGYAVGEYNNPYEGNDPRHAEYKWGYDRGVSAYCHEQHPEDEGV
jgi:hypothetical protein